MKSEDRSVDLLTICLHVYCERRHVTKAGIVGYKIKKAQTKGTQITSEQFWQK